MIWRVSYKIWGDVLRMKDLTHTIHGTGPVYLPIHEFESIFNGIR